nr:hypothetical protein [Smithellaceae bacterium]
MDRITSKSASEILSLIARISEAIGRLNVLIDRARELRLRRRRRGTRWLPTPLRELAAGSGKGPPGCRNHHSPPSHPLSMIGIMEPPIFAVMEPV